MILQTKDDQISSENSLFIKEVMKEKFDDKSPVKGAELVKTEWDSKTKRTGLIARNIGVYPMWENDGKKVLCTLLHVRVWKK